MVPVTAFFAGLLALIFIALSVYVIVRRYTVKVAIGDGGDTIISRRIRAHANFAEYVPIALILMALNEINGASESWLALAGWALVLGRLLHAFSLTRFEVRRGKIIFRQIGMALTFTVIAVLALSAMA